MQISAERTVVILREVFPECNDIKVSTETQLGENCPNLGTTNIGPEIYAKALI
jgi:hypothetical protein